VITAGHSTTSSVNIYHYNNLKKKTPSFYSNGSLFKVKNQILLLENSKIPKVKSLSIYIRLYYANRQL